MRDLWRGWRALKRWFWPGAPNAKLLVLGAMALIALLAIFTYVVNWGYWSRGDKACTGHDLRCGLGIHVAGTFLVGVIAYYLIFLRREARAARRWRRRAKKRPQSLFASLPPLDGLTGEARSQTSLVRRPRETGWRVPGWIRRRWGKNSLVESIISRDELVNDLVDELDESCAPRILVAPSGSGKTMVLLKLARQLARHGHVPVVVSVRGIKEPELDFANLAHEVYTRHSGVHSKEEADKQWRWLRKRNRITVLVDELEKSDAEPAERVQALEKAARERLRVVLSCRSEGIPNDYRRGRITLDPLEEEKVVRDLQDRFEQGPTNAPRLRDDEIELLVKRAQIDRTPYYLAIARVLIAIGRLGIPDVSEDARLFLMSTYRDAIADCTVRPDAGLSAESRRRYLGDLEAVAYARLLGAATEPEVQEKIEAVVPNSSVKVKESVRAGVRLGVLRNRYDGRIHFGHPTTVAYFASCFLVAHKNEPRVWDAVFDLERVSTLLALALSIANARAKDHEVNEQTVRYLMERVKSTNGLAPVKPDGDDDGADTVDETTNNDFIEHFERLWLIATAAEISSLDSERSPGVTADLVAMADLARGEGEQVAVARRQVVRAIGKLDESVAFESLWSIASEHDDYVVRRQAALTLIDAGDRALNCLAPQLCEVIKEAWQAFTKRPADEKADQELIQATKSAAWILPSFRTIAGDRGSPHLECLNRARDRLWEVSRSLTPQLGVEPSTAQGLKSDARRDPQAGIDQIATKMAIDKKLRARFWFSRVLALQAVTRRAVAPEGEDVQAPKVDEAIKVIEQARQDEHPFVVATANLCLHAVKRGDWYRYQWDDMTDIAAGAPHHLVDAATQLIGDMVLALNLYETGLRPAKLKFAKSNQLPVCLSTSKDRLEILGSVPRSPKCAFTDGHPCFCPYLYESPQPGLVRRELSRAFCRHLRLTARPVPWQPKIPVRQIKAFWSDMEDLAQF